MADDKLQATARSTGMVAEGVVKGFILVAPSLMLVSVVVGATVWLARIGTSLGGMD
tara:strand:- start:2374 stop:2541 length:168 start_codon:yes stop_codon:yes gene_type:complete